METGHHLVARQTIEVIATDRAMAEALAARTSSVADRLATAIEAGLDALDSAGARLQLDRVELDLASCDPARWEEALVDGVRQGLARKVVDAVKRGGTGGSDAAATALRLLEAFARIGRLPWWCAPADTPESAIETLVSLGCDPRAVRAILLWPAAIERFASQLDEPLLISLLQLARPDLGREGATTIAAMASLSPQEAPATARQHASRAATWRAILAEAASTSWREPANLALSAEQPASREAVIQMFLMAIARRRASDTVQPGSGAYADAAAPTTTGTRSPVRTSPSDIPASREERTMLLSASLKALAGDNPATAAVLARLASLADQLDGPTMSAAQAVADGEAGPPMVMALIHVFAEAGLIERAEAAQWREALAAAMVASDDPHDAIALETAGLPLVAPFLPIFFHELELLDEEQYRSPAARHRAATVLHYLATGATAAAEQDLPLAKALAGIGLDEIYEAGEPLTDFEIASCEALLEALLGHAPMLGRIGVAGLRSAFLLRPGLLSTRDGHWLLRVERRSIDVLVDRLPWSFAWVRLPWMQAPLQVEW
jgi:hypothetical protein